MGRCSRCQLEAMKRRAAKVGAEVIVRPSNFQLQGRASGVEVFVVPKNEELNESRDSDGNQGPQWRAWFALLPDKCAC